MSRFEIRRGRRELTPDIADRYVDLIDNETGAKARVNLKGANLEQLFLKFDGEKDPVSVVYSYADWEAFERGVSRLKSTDQLDDTQALNAYLLGSEHATWASGTVISPANRLLDGILLTMNPDGSIIDRLEFEPNHDSSHSLLHGYVMNGMFGITDKSESDSGASVTLRVPVGYNMPGYGERVHAYITFSLKKDGLYEQIRIINEGGKPTPISLSRHLSLRVGDIPLDNHYLSMHALGMLETDDVNNPTGRYVPQQLFIPGQPLYLGNINLDGTFVMGDSQKVTLMTDGGLGLNLEAAGEHSKTVTLWNNVLPGNYNHQFLAWEVIEGTHAAGLSRGGLKPWEQADLVFNQHVVNPGEESYSLRKIQPIRE